MSRKLDNPSKKRVRVFSPHGSPDAAFLFLPNVVRALETKRQSLENDLQSLRAKYSDHDADIKALDDKIETLQSSNRTNLSIIESNNKRDQTLTDELTKQHQRNVELARELTIHQQSEQNAKGQLNSAKYQQEALQQEVDLSRQNAKWLGN